MFIDLSFVEVLLDPSDDRHRAASNEFDRLLVEYRARVDTVVQPRWSWGCGR